MSLRHKLLNVQTGRIMYKQPEYTSGFVKLFMIFSVRSLSTVATYYHDSHDFPCRRDVCCHLGCHGGGCHSCRSGGGSCLGCDCIADDDPNLAHLRSVDFCPRCLFGTTGADRGRCCVALSHLCQSFLLRTTASAGAWRSHHSTAQAAACGAATSCCSSWLVSVDCPGMKRISAFGVEVYMVGS